MEKTGLSLTTIRALNIAQAGDDVGYFSLSGPVSGSGPFTFALVSGSDQFSIEQNRLVIKTVPSAPAAFSVQVRMTDAGQYTLEKTFPIDLLSPQERDFYCTDLTVEQYGKNYPAHTRLLAAGTFSLIYGETGGSRDATGEEAAKIAAEFDEKIYGPICDAFGKPLDMDGNKRVILFLLDIRDGYDRDTNTAYIAGYFDSGDMQQNIYSNRAEMLYIDTCPAELDSEESYRTLAHELQHLINFSNRAGIGKQAEDLWINEGLSTAAEHIYTGGALQDRIAWLTNSSVSFIYGNNFFVWDGYWENSFKIGNTTYGADSLTNYATAYLFFQWLRIHANNDIEIYRDIIDSPYGDYRAVTAAAEKNIGPRYEDWPTLLGTWFAANFLQNTDAESPYGYKGQMPFAAGTYFAPGGDSLTLAPGEGVYSKLNENKTCPSSGNIHYGALNAWSGQAEFDRSLYRQGKYQYLLTFNGNTNTAGGSETGLVADQIQAPSLLNTNAGANIRTALPGTEQKVPELWQWDGAAYFFRHRRR